MSGVKVKEVRGRYVLVVERFKGGYWVMTSPMAREGIYREKGKAVERLAILKAI